MKKLIENYKLLRPGILIKRISYFEIKKIYNILNLKENCLNKALRINFKAGNGKLKFILKQSNGSL